MLKKLRHLSEYALLRPVLFLFVHLPIAAVEGPMAGLAGLWYRCHASRRRTACENIERAGIATDPKEIDRIARESFRHFGIMVIECMRASRLLADDTWADYVKLDASPAALEILSDPEQAVILTTGHIGNWELGASAVSFMKPVTTVVRPMDNPYVDTLMHRRDAGHRTSVPKYDISKTRFLTVLRNKQALGIVIDQHTHTGSMLVDFFGVPAHTQTSHARLHRVMGTPIIFLACIRTGVMSYTLHIPPPVIHKKTKNKEHDTKVVLEQCNRLLEEAIRRNPEQYLWAHRRWKDVP
ncbi:lysophospholipid acyltransferase family protein [Verrucomicrobiota bacterium]